MGVWFALVLVVVQQPSSSSRCRALSCVRLSHERLSERAPWSHEASRGVYLPTGHVLGDRGEFDSLSRSSDWLSAPSAECLFASYFFGQKIECTRRFLVTIGYSGAFVQSEGRTGRWT